MAVTMDSVVAVEWTDEQQVMYRHASISHYHVAIQPDSTSKDLQSTCPRCPDYLPAQTNKWYRPGDKLRTTSIHCGLTKPLSQRHSCTIVTDKNFQHLWQKKPQKLTAIDDISGMIEMYLALVQCWHGAQQMKCAQIPLMSVKSNTGAYWKWYIKLSTLHLLQYQHLKQAQQEVSELQIMEIVYKYMQSLFLYLTDKKPMTSGIEHIYDKFLIKLMPVQKDNLLQLQPHFKDTTSELMIISSPFGWKTPLMLGLNLSNLWIDWQLSTSHRMPSFNTSSSVMLNVARLRV